jgi:hypothetical protein
MNDLVRKIIRAVNTGGKSSLKFVIPALLTIAVTFFLTTHLKPDLTLYFSDGEVITYQMRDEPNKFRIFLLDWLEENGPQIVSATDVTFRSAKDVKWRSDRTSQAWISKLFIDNDGWVTANHITIGIGIPKGAESLKVVASPNITILSDNIVQTSANYLPYRKIEIERLGRSEKAVLTVVTACLCGSPARSKSADSDLFISTDKSSKNNSAILFLSSQEGTGRVLDTIDMRSAFALEKSLFPSSTSGYWATGFDISKNAEPKVALVEHMKLTMSVDDKDGKEREVTLTFP